MKNFKDYEDKKELIGKYVLYIYGNSYNIKKNRIICKITLVTKTGFKISYNKKYLFNFDGIQKRRQNIGNISYCKLINDNEKDKIINEFNNKEKKK